MSEPAAPYAYVIAGPNGSGKTTFARRFLRHFDDCRRFVNADLIAAGLSPFAPEEVSFRAGRLMLEEIRRLETEHVSFAFETTLSGKSYLPLIRRFRDKGYSVHLIFLWPQSMDLTLRRIKARVRLGGHNIPEADVRRRFLRTIRNLFQHYRFAVNSWKIVDNSSDDFVTIAEEAGGKLAILDSEIFAALTELGGTHDDDEGRDS